MRRSKGRNAREVQFTKSMKLQTSKVDFLLNSNNKQRFIAMLADGLRESGVSVSECEADADVAVVQRAVEVSQNAAALVIGEDTDLIVYLLHYTKDNQITYLVSGKSLTGADAKKVWDISQIQSKIGSEVCLALPFLHSLLGCDTTSRLYSVGKSLALKKVLSTSNSPL